jgi:hypothetical protein
MAAPSPPTDLWDEIPSTVQHELQQLCHRSAGTPLGMNANGEAQGLKAAHTAIRSDRGSCDDTQISYLEILEDSDNDNLRLARMLAG